MVAAASAPLGASRPSCAARGVARGTMALATLAWVAGLWAGVASLGMAACGGQARRGASGDIAEPRPRQERRAGLDPWSFASEERALACEALGRQLRARRPGLAPLMALPEDPLLVERAALCGRSIEVLAEAARVELLTDASISVSTREDADLSESIEELELRRDDLARRRARAATWLADAERERRLRGGGDVSATESMARVVLAWSGPSSQRHVAGRDATAALAEVRAAVDRGSLPPASTARLRFALAVLAGERAADAVPSGLSPELGYEGDFESAVEVLAWARMRDELGLHASVKAWLRRSRERRGTDPTMLGAGLGNADRVYLRGLIATVGDDADGARAWFRLLLTLDDVDPDVRTDASARLRGLEVLSGAARPAGD